MTRLVSVLLLAFLSPPAVGQSAAAGDSTVAVPDVATPKVEVRELQLPDTPIFDPTSHVNQPSKAEQERGMVLDLMDRLDNEATLAARGYLKMDLDREGARLGNQSWTFRDDPNLVTSGEAADLIGNRDYNTDLPEHALLAKNRGPILRAVRGFTSRCQDRGLRLFKRGDDEANARVARWDSSNVLIVSPLVSEAVFNELRMDSDERTEAMLRDCMLPLLTRFEDINREDFDYVGVVLAYGFVDVSDRWGITETEIVALATPLDALAEVSSGAITERGLISKSLIFRHGSDRNMRRISIDR